MADEREQVAELARLIFDHPKECTSHFQIVTRTITTTTTEWEQA